MKCSTHVFFIYMYVPEGKPKLSAITLGDATVDEGFQSTSDSTQYLRQEYKSHTLSPVKSYRLTYGRRGGTGYVRHHST